MYSSFPARESLGLISYVTASQLLGALTQDSLLLLPSHNTACVIRENIKRKDLETYRFPMLLNRYSSMVSHHIAQCFLSVRPLNNKFVSFFHNMPCDFRESKIKRIEQSFLPSL